MIMFLRKVLITVIGFEARLILWRYQPKIIAITGSVGKTSTKDAIYAMISSTVHARRSRKSFNSSIGIPLTILGAPTGWRDILKWIRNVLKGLWLIVRPWGSYPEWLVLELGISKPGDMQTLKKWVRPHVVVVSAFGSMPSHVEFFDTKEDVWNEEASIIEALDPHGLLVLNYDDPHVMKCTQYMQSDQTLITYGYGADADVAIDDASYLYTDQRVSGMRISIRHHNKQYSSEHYGILGKHIGYGLAAGIAVHNHLFGALESIDEHVQKLSFPLGRLNLIDGIHDSVIIDDTYNSSPPALKLALQTLGDINTSSKKIAILGDMLELGKYSDEAHEKAGAQAARTADYIVTVGPRAKQLYLTAQNLGLDDERLFHAQDAHEAAAWITPHIQSGDIILIKGSQGVRMEHAVKALMKHPEDAGRLLTRQDEAWIGKR